MLDTPRIKQCERSGCGNSFRITDSVQRFCSRSCAAQYREIVRQLNAWQRMWSRIIIVDSGCWEWCGATDRDGYGKLRYRGEISAHRSAWTMCYGKIPESKWILHKCDNPRCCNPLHLFLGDSTDNVMDMVSKGRNSHGDSHACAILNSGDIVQIKRLAMQGIKQSSMASLFKVHPSTINHVIHHRTWNHLA